MSRAMPRAAGSVANPNRTRVSSDGEPVTSGGNPADADTQHPHPQR